MMMERMMANKENHSEESRRIERSYEDFPSHEEFLQSSHYNHYLYEPPPRQHRSRHHHHSELKVYLPHFFGKESVDEYLDWKMKVEQLFECY